MGAEYSNLRKSKSQSDHEKFIIKYSKSKTINMITDISDLDQRRIVFVSMVGAFKTWQKVPLLGLYSCIFILPIKKQWLYDPFKYRSDIDATFIGQITLFQDHISEVQQFIQMLKWKDTQGLVFFTMDESDKDEPHSSSETNALNGIVHPFWDHFSNRLSSLYDSISSNTYNSLKLDELWWRNSFKSERDCQCKYDSSFVSVLEEIYFLNGRYKAMQEMLYQSNPDSLNPIITYDHLPTECKKTSREKPKPTLEAQMKPVHDQRTIEAYKDESGLVILSDYFDE